MSGVVYCPARSVAYRMVGMHDAKVERYAPRFAVVRTRMARNLPSLSSASSAVRSEEHTSELQSHSDLVCRHLLEKNNTENTLWQLADSFKHIVARFDKHEAD